MTMPHPHQIPTTVEETVAAARRYWQWGTEPMSQLLLELLSPLKSNGCRRWRVTATGEMEG